MAQHYYVVVYNDEKNRWKIDTLEMECRYPNGTIYCDELEDWTYGYQDDGKFYRNADEIDITLLNQIRKLNEGK